MFTGKIKSGVDFKSVTAPWLKDKTSKHKSSGSGRPSPRTRREMVGFIQAAHGDPVSKRNLLGCHWILKGLCKWKDF